MHPKQNIHGLIWWGYKEGALAPSNVTSLSTSYTTYVHQVKFNCFGEKLHWKDYVRFPSSSDLSPSTSDDYVTFCKLSCKEVSHMANLPTNLGCTYCITFTCCHSNRDGAFFFEKLHMRKTRHAVLRDGFPLYYIDCPPIISCLLNILQRGMP